MSFSTGAEGAVALVVTLLLLTFKSVPLLFTTLISWALICNNEKNKNKYTEIFSNFFNFF